MSHSFLFSRITSHAEALSFLSSLNAAGLSFHPDDEPSEISCFEPEEAAAVAERMSEVRRHLSEEEMYSAIRLEAEPEPEPKQPDGERQAWAQVSSICELIEAAQMDWDRLEELREKREAGRYVAGFNMPGYLPDSEPAIFETADEARTYLADQMAESAEMAEGREAEILTMAAESLRSRTDEEEASEYGATLCGLHYWLTFEPGKLADEEEAEELEEMEKAANDMEDADEAEQRISEHPLSVEVRSGWVSQGEKMQPEEFRIVLCTGGPHVEIVGEMDNGQATRARVLWRDWFEGGEIFGFSHSSILEYCNRFLYA